MAVPMIVPMTVPIRMPPDTSQDGMAKSGAFAITTWDFGVVDDGPMVDTMVDWGGGGWLQASGTFTHLRSIPIRTHTSRR